MSGRARPSATLLRAALSSVVLVLPLAVAWMSPQPARGATGYTVETHVLYQVDATLRRIAVSVAVVFTNTTPDAGGRLSGFDRVDLVVHDGASQVEAEDGSGPLTASVASDGVSHASVTMRSRVRYNASASFILRYLLDDGAPGVHVRPQVVQFATWSIGTSGDVTVEVPVDYEVSADGGVMTAGAEGVVTVLESGPIADPGSWAARITGTRESTYVTSSVSVALASGTVDLQVSAWPDDPEWGRRTLALLRSALPLLEDAAGLPYPRVGPLVVRESVADPAATVEPPTYGAEILAAFDQPDFTLLHQAAHLWIDDRLAAELWIREGLASHIAAQAARALDVELPYNPARQAAELQDAAIPLISWTAASDAHGHAGSWAFVDRIAATVGEGRLRLALARIAAGLSAYDPAGPGQAPLGERRLIVAVDSRRFLDQLTAVSRSDVSAAFGETVFSPETRGELAQRTVARLAYADLLAAAGDWGAPDSVRAAMADWRFAEARQRITQAGAWLEDLDAMVMQISLVGLTTPDRLRDAYRTDADPRAELRAAAAVVEAYGTLRHRAANEQGPVEQIGMIGGADPDELLAAAGVAFAEGDLQGTVETIDLASARLDRATSEGLVRISAVMILVGLIGYAATRVARRPNGSDYTAGS